MRTLVLKKRDSSFLLLHPDIGKSWVYISARIRKNAYITSPGVLLDCDVSHLKKQLVSMEMIVMPTCKTYEQLRCLHQLLSIVDTVVPHGGFDDRLIPFFQRVYKYLPVSTVHQQALFTLHLLYILGIIPEHAGWLSFVQKGMMTYDCSVYTQSDYSQLHQAVNFCMKSLQSM